MNLPKSVTLVICLTLGGSYTWGQQPNTNGRKAARTEKKPQISDSASLSPKQQQALGRLEAIGEQAKALDGSILKVKTLAKVANALWEYDNSRARLLFTMAFQSIASIKLNQTDQRVQFANRYSKPGPLHQLRSEVLQMIAQRDLKLAQQLRAKATEEEKNKQNPKESQEEQADTSLELARSLSKTQPEQASQVVREHLRAGVSEALVATLLGIRRENPTLADNLFQETLARARADLAAPNNIINLALYALPTEEDILLERNPAKDATRIAAIQSFLDFAQESLEAQFRDGGAALMESNDKELQREHQVLRLLLPFFQQLRPPQVAFVQDKMAALLGLMSPQQSNIEASKTRQESIDELLHQAESTIGERKQTIAFIRASSLALAQGNLVQALDIASRISDLREREIQTSIILYQISLKEINKGDLEESHRRAQGIQFLPQRVGVFVKLAHKLTEGKEVERARTALEEIWDWVSKRDNHPQKIAAMLNLTATMTQHDKFRGFEFLQATIKALNGTDFTPPPANTQNVSIEVQLSLDMLDFEAGLAPLAKDDFERVFLMAQSILPRDASLLAQAIACQEALGVSAKSRFPDKRRKQ
jgi:hypothetical protein